MRRFQTVGDAISQGDARRNIMEGRVELHSASLKKAASAFAICARGSRVILQCALGEFSSSLEAQFPTTFQLTRKGERQAIETSLSVTR